MVGALWDAWSGWRDQFRLKSTMQRVMSCAVAMSEDGLQYMAGDCLRCAAATERLALSDIAASGNFWQTKGLACRSPGRCLRQWVCTGCGTTTARLCSPTLLVVPQCGCWALQSCKGMFHVRTLPHALNAAGPAPTPTPPVGMQATVFTCAVRVSRIPLEGFQVHVLENSSLTAPIKDDVAPNHTATTPS